MGIVIFYLESGAVRRFDGHRNSDEFCDRQCKRRTGRSVVGGDSIVINWTGSRSVAGFANFEHIQQSQFEHEVLLVGSGGAGLRLVDMGEHDFAFGNQSLAAGGTNRDRTALFAGVDQFRRVDQLIAGLGPAVKGHLGHLGQDDDVLEPVAFAEQDSAGLSHASIISDPGITGKPG